MRVKTSQDLIVGMFFEKFSWLGIITDSEGDSDSDDLEVSIVGVKIY